MGQQLHSNITIPASATTLIEKKGDNYIYRRPDYYCMSTVKKKQNHTVRSKHMLHKGLTNSLALLFFSLVQKTSFRSGLGEG